MLLYNWPMRYQLLLFDLDETLYPPTSGLWNAIAVRMQNYMAEKLGIADDQVDTIRRSYFDKYGTTLKGLQSNYQVDAVDFLRYVHDIPLDQVLEPDPALRPLLLSLPQKKWICTNADRGHAQRVLNYLGVKDCFAGITDIIDANFDPKPSKAFYQTTLSMAGVQDPQTCVLFDDLPRNLEPASLMGLTTVLVRSEAVRTGQAVPYASFMVPSVHALPEVFPGLWESVSKTAPKTASRTASKTAR
jgi:putative hydrolase of the HAD superfamily